MEKQRDKAAKRVQRKLQRQSGIPGPDASAEDEFAEPGAAGAAEEPGPGPEPGPEPVSGQ